MKNILERLLKHELRINFDIFRFYQFELEILRYLSDRNSIFEFNMLSHSDFKK